MTLSTKSGGSCVRPAYLGGARGRSGSGGGARACVERWRERGGAAQQRAARVVRHACSCLCGVPGCSGGRPPGPAHFARRLAPPGLCTAAGRAPGRGQPGRAPDIQLVALPRLHQPLLQQLGRHIDRHGDRPRARCGMGSEIRPPASPGSAATGLLGTTGSSDGCKEACMLGTGPAQGVRRGPGGGAARGHLPLPLDCFPCAINARVHTHPSSPL